MRGWAGALERLTGQAFRYPVLSGCAGTMCIDNVAMCARRCAHRRYRVPTNAADRGPALSIVLIQSTAPRPARTGRSDSATSGPCLLFVRRAPPQRWLVGAPGEMLRFPSDGAPEHSARTSQSERAFQDS